MTLQEALQSGKPFARSEDDDFCTTFEELGLLSVEDVMSTTWVVKDADDIDMVVSKAFLARMWDRAREGTTTIGAAETSPFFKRFINFIEEELDQDYEE